MHHRDVAGAPVVAHAVVDLVAAPVEDVERRFVHVAVLLRPAARAVFLQMDMQGLGDAVHRLHIVPAVGLGAVDELDLVTLAHPRLGAQPGELVLELVVPGDAAHEHAVLLAVVVRFDAHAANYTPPLRPPWAFRGADRALRAIFGSRGSWLNTSDLTVTGTVCEGMRMRPTSM